MTALADHPALAARRGRFAPMEDVHKLAVHLHNLLYLDPSAVYRMNGGSTVVYYHSALAKPLPEGSSCRIVLAPDGKHRRIGIVGVDPR